MRNFFNFFIGRNPNTYFVSVLDRWPVKDKVEMLKKLLLERISLAGICRVLNICEKTLTKYMNIIFSGLPDHLNVDLSYCQIYKTKKGAGTTNGLFAKSS